MWPLLVRCERPRSADQDDRLRSKGEAAFAAGWLVVDSQDSLVASALMAKGGTRRAFIGALTMDEDEH